MDTIPLPIKLIASGSLALAIGSILHFSELHRLGNFVGLIIGLPLTRIGLIGLIVSR